MCIEINISSEIIKSEEIISPSEKAKHESETKKKSKGEEHACIRKKQSEAPEIRKSGNRALFHSRFY